MRPRPGRLATVDNVRHYQHRAEIAAFADRALRDVLRVLREAGATNAADAVARARKSIQGARNHARAQVSHLTWSMKT